MKQFLCGLILLAVIGCGNATDGDPSTDTTTMNPDPYVGRDTVTHLNRLDGTVPADTAKRDTTARQY